MALALEKEDSVYDFLYVDARRIAIFVSQLTQNGSIVSLSRTASDTTTSGGGLNVGVVKIDSTGSGQTSQTRQFDAQWVAPLNFLDEAQKHGMINREIESARIGSLVLVSGTLSVFDVAMLKTAWEIPSVKRLLLGAAIENSSGDSHPQPTSRQERRRQERFKQPQSSSSQEAGVDMLGILPHATLAAVSVGSVHAWCTLKEDSLVVSPSDLLLKHGISIPGEWSMLGILDAFPDNADPTEQDGDVGMALGSIGEFLGSFAPAIRHMLGRPAGAHGVTPVLIFREINA